MDRDLGIVATLWQQRRPTSSASPPIGPAACAA